MCFVFVIMNIVFATRIAGFCGFPSSTIGSMKAIGLNAVHGIEV